MAAEAQELPVDPGLRARLEGLVAAGEDWEARASGVLNPKKVDQHNIWKRALNFWTSCKCRLGWDSHSSPAPRQKCHNFSGIGKVCDEAVPQ